MLWVFMVELIECLGGVWFCCKIIDYGYVIVKVLFDELKVLYFKCFGVGCL